MLKLTLSHFSIALSMELELCCSAMSLFPSHPTEPMLSSGPGDTEVHEARWFHNVISQTKPSWLSLDSNLLS